MKVLVTGSKGFIGQHLVRELKERYPEWEITECDLKDGKDAGDEFTDEYSIIYHLAAMTDVEECEADPEKCRETNALLLKKMLTSFKGLFIFTSTVAAQKPNSVYGKSKLDGEGFVKQYKNHIIFRLANVYGPGGHGVINKFLEANPITINGDGSQTRDFIHVDEVVSYLAIAPMLQSYRLYYLTSDIQISIKDIAHSIRFVRSYDTKIEYKDSLGKFDVPTSPERLKKLPWLRCFKKVHDSILEMVID